MAGIYIHVPFCDGKCPYCDFYSLSPDEESMERYTQAVLDDLAKWGRGPQPKVKAESVYFGGGTPSLLGAPRLARLLQAAGQRFALAAAAEITLEANPGSVGPEFFTAAKKAGFNRLSMGLQSANGDELALLGRKHSAQDARQAVAWAREAGFGNISVDLMLGLPGGSVEKLGRSIDFAAGLGVEHISAYILKIEPGTPFAAGGIQLPEEDESADEYLFLVERLGELGYEQYEISNFSKPGFAGRHNLIYWHDREYLGFGPAAHSFYAGRRYYYPRDLQATIAGRLPVQEGRGGDIREYAMLALRLTEGLSSAGCEDRYGQEGIEAYLAFLSRAQQCPPDLVQADGRSIRFTPQGFLVSNTLLGRILG